MSASTAVGSSPENGAIRRGPGRPARTESERAAQRARLLDSVMAGIRQLGAYASVDHLAAAAGVSKPVLYDEFGGKEGIADAIGEELAQRAERQFIARLVGPDPLDIFSGVRAVIDTLWDLVAEESEIYGFVVRCVRVSDRRLLDNGFVRALDRRVQPMSRLLAPGTEPAVVTMLAHGVLGFVIFAVESWQTTRRPTREELLDAVMTLIQNGLGAVSPP
ncbi:MAG: TetR/AcrR family transcriptional regulator, partial [Acidimicrobiales bacterium]